jgi:hypothetical protein
MTRVATEREDNGIGAWGFTTEHTEGTEVGGG